MLKRKGSSGFTLIEILLVLAILGIVAGIAIPTFMGQRRRARIVGDAISNAQVIRMQLETKKADNGSYGFPATYSWTKSPGGYVITDPTFLPSFTPQGNSQLNFVVNVDPPNGLTYRLDVMDPSLGGATVYSTDQTGQQIYRLN
jgi:type IV pilus assembly protein PilE